MGVLIGILQFKSRTLTVEQRHGVGNLQKFTKGTETVKAYNFFLEYSNF